MWHIREGKETDLDEIRQIISSAIRQCVTDSDEHYEFLYSDVCCNLDWWIDNKERALLLVCEQDDSILGMAFVKEFWNFAALFVDPKQLRSGVGRDLVTSVITNCKHRSPKGCLMLNSSSYAAPFYKKMGFVQTGDAINRPGGCVPFKLMFNT
ncbi:MAG: GNAT family N-acetyltransferase [Planctomycetota bacterium]|jgi:N-acetylglutamate synthase-like GNAT family acetyltransferase